MEGQGELESHISFKARERETLHSASMVKMWVYPREREKRESVGETESRGGTGHTFSRIKL